MPPCPHPRRWADWPSLLYARARRGGRARAHVVGVAIVVIVVVVVVGVAIDVVIDGNPPSERFGA